MTFSRLCPRMASLPSSMRRMMPPLTPAFLSFFLFAGASLFLAGESRADDGVMLDSIMAVVNHHSITKSEVDR